MGRTIRKSFVGLVGAAFIIGSAHFALALLPNDTTSSLQLHFGKAGIERVIYRGSVLDDLSVHPEDAFRVGHMKVTDLKGNVSQKQQDTWGENCLDRGWDASSRAFPHATKWLEVVRETAGRGGSDRRAPVDGGGGLWSLVCPARGAPSGLLATVRAHDSRSARRATRG